MDSAQAGLGILAVRAALALFDDAMRASRAFAAFRGDAKVIAQGAQRVDALLHGLAYLTLRDGMADADIHGRTPYDLYALIV